MDELLNLFDLNAQMSKYNNYMFDPKFKLYKSKYYVTSICLLF